MTAFGLPVYPKGFRVKWVTERFGPLTGRVVDVTDRPNHTPLYTIALDYSVELGPGDVRDHVEVWGSCVIPE